MLQVLKFIIRLPSPDSDRDGYMLRYLGRKRKLKTAIRGAVLKMLEKSFISLLLVTWLTLLYVLTSQN